MFWIASTTETDWMESVWLLLTQPIQTSRPLVPAFTRLLADCAGCRSQRGIRTHATKQHLSNNFSASLHCVRFEIGCNAIFVGVCATKNNCASVSAGNQF